VADTHCIAEKDASFGAHHKNLNEDTPILSAAKMKADESSFWRYKVYADIHGGSLGSGRQKTVWLSSTAIFRVFAGYFFGNFRDEAGIIIQRYAVRRQLFSDLKMYDLEWLFRIKFFFHDGSARSDLATFEK